MHLIDQELFCMLRGQFDEGWEISEQIQAIGQDEITDPDGKKSPEMWLRHNFNRGWFLLHQGKFQEGSQLLESGRFLNVYGSGRLQTDKPIWRNENLNGKTVILSLEGGYGDEIIHVRFAKSLAERGATVVVAADPKIASVFARIEGVSQVIQRNQAITIEHDFWIPGFSAGWLCGHTYDNLPQDPYIFPRSDLVEQWKKTIKSEKIKVGIRWSGNPEFEHQQFRRFPPEYLIALAQCPELQIYSLQRDNDIQKLPENIIDLHDQLVTWEDTAAAIANLDLVISSCTSVAHLAAAMGKTTWVLAPILPYHTWAYKAPENKNSPWYTSVELYRQKKFADWGETFLDLYSNLTKKYKLSITPALSTVPEAQAIEKVEISQSVPIDSTQNIFNGYKSHSTKVNAAYVICLPNNKISSTLAARCLESCAATQMPAYLYEGFDGTGDQIKIPAALKDAGWYKWIKVTDHHLSQAEIACALSHIALWVKCMELDQPIVILEHDAIMVKPYLVHEVYNSISYLGCNDQRTKTHGTLIPPYSSINKNWLFINRAHAYSIDPAAARKLFTTVLSRGIFESLDIMIQADTVAIVQTGFYAYDEPGETIIKERKKDV